MFSITSLSTGVTSIFFFLAGFAVLRSWQKDKGNVLLKYFLVFLFGIAFQQLFFSLSTGSITLNPRVNAYLWAVAHITMFTYLSFFLRLPFRVHFPRLEKPVFFAAIFYSLIGGSILLLNAPQINSYLLENGIFIFEIPSLSVKIIVIFTVVCLLSLIGFFFYHAYKEKEKFVRFRSIFIAVAILIYLTSGPAHNFVRTPGLTFLVDFLLVVSGLFMLAGVYIRKLFPALSWPPDFLGIK